MTDWQAVLNRSGLLDRLAPFDVRVVGTFPLGLTVTGSDVDLVCNVRDCDAFAHVIHDACGEHPDYAMWQWCREPRPLVARFTLEGLPFEIYGAAGPVETQYGWRHFEVERRLLALGGDALRRAVLVVRGDGAKTEAAFARVLGLDGDPYEVLHALSHKDDAALAKCLRRAGFQVFKTVSQTSLSPSQCSVSGGM